MKKILIFFFALGLLTACDNDKGNANKTQTDNRAKDDYRTNSNKDDKTTKDNTDNNTRTKDEKAEGETKDTETKDNKDGWGDKGNVTSWSQTDKTRFMTDCEGTAEKNVGAARAHEYCDCMLQKLTKLFSSYTEANTELGGRSRDKLAELAADCNKQ
jgi:hypothetical protein